MNTKPIFIIGMPDDNYEELDQIRETLSGQLPDYHVLIYSSLNYKDPQFNAFYPSDFEEKKMEEIKRWIKEEINKKIL